MRRTFTTLVLATAALFGLQHPAQSQTVYALTAPSDLLSFSLFSFDAAAPNAVSFRGNITGLVGNPFLLGIEVRPATGQLLALAYLGNPTAPQVRLFELNPTTSAATPIGPAVTLSGSSLAGKVGFSIDPTTDQVRIVTAAGSSYRLSPTTGALLGTDVNLSYASTDAHAGQAPNLQSISYTNNFNGSTATQLFGIDKTSNQLVQQASSPGSPLATVGPLGVNPDNFDLGFAANAQSQTNTLYLMSVITGRSNISNWYSVNTTTGAATLIGIIGVPNVYFSIWDVAVTKALITATRDRVEVAADFNVYPNPAAGTAGLGFRLLRAGQVELRVTDALGRRMATPPAAALAAGPHKLSWETAGVRAGLYSVRLLVDGQVAAERQVAVAE
jgi:hypothetical protein